MSTSRKYPRAPYRVGPGFAFSMVNRALREHLSQRMFTQSDMDLVDHYFGKEPLECVYCGSQLVRGWEHLVPVNAGGITVIGNMVPACGPCDDSKQKMTFDQWMVSDRDGSPKKRGIPDVPQRIAKIREYMTHFGYVPAAWEASLTLDEQAQVTRILDKVLDLRADIDTLIRQYRSRNGK